MNLLIVGGAAPERLEVARAFHLSSLSRNGTLLSIDAGSDERRIRSTLETWISGADEPGGDLLRLAERGTLFLDRVACLSRESQRMLLAFTRHRLDVLSAGEESWVGRLAVGSPDSLVAAVERGLFDAALYDALDKVRVELPPSGAGAVGCDLRAAHGLRGNRVPRTHGRAFHGDSIAFESVGGEGATLRQAYRE